MAPPLAGRPPFATDEPDSYYKPGPQRRNRQPGPPNSNDRTSAYAMYDDYLNNFDSENYSKSTSHPKLDKHMPQLVSYKQNLVYPAPSKHLEAHTPSKHTILAAAAGVSHKSPPPPVQRIAAPKPGYVAPIASLDVTQLGSAVTARRHPVTREPPPTANNPFEPQPQQQNPFETPRRNHFQPPQLNHYGPYPHSTATPIPSTPHPLQPPITPIIPVFARPSKEIKYRQEEPIMRSRAEDIVLPSRGQRGDDFWRRFSMVIREQEQSNGKKKSTWLSKTQSGRNRMSRWLWVIGITLILLIGGAVGLGWWASHNNDTQTEPSTLGGSSKETTGPVVSKTTARASLSSKSASQVTPTFTVARREFIVE